MRRLAAPTARVSARAAADSAMATLSRHIHNFCLDRLDRLDRLDPARAAN
jgi:hypothetical protein